ncbi:Sec24p [Malassezia vespertilionis]|uniref:Sec24p n=2 Tax=Malassezia vespertilionis TaxID=2020962 RepID=A0A2N1JH07_9BASI|nr:Sec24p [Malassezia vespertilionis]
MPSSAPEDAPSGARRAPPSAAASRRRAYPTAHLTANSVSYAGQYNATQPPATPGSDAVFTPATMGHSPMRSVSGQLQGTRTPTKPRVASMAMPDTVQAQPAPAADASGLAAQMQSMAVSAAPGTRQANQLYNTVLGAQPVNMTELDQPPPPIQLAPGACLSGDVQANADPTYQRSTLNAIPTTSSMLNKSKLPLAIVLTPMRSVRSDLGDTPVPVVSDSVIARCRRCRTYINPFVTFVEGGHRWRCCMCNITNEVPQLFDWNQETNQPADRWKRAELNSSIVEFIAPREYMVRPPQPPVYVFLIDVGHAAVQCGMVDIAAKTILANLDRIPNRDKRTKMAVIGFDTHLHFFKVTPHSPEPTMMVVSDVLDVFLPQPNDLLVNLSEERSGLESLLFNLGSMFTHTTAAGSALGPALQAAHKLIAAPGGKVEVFTASLASMGAGALKMRDDRKLYGGPRESSLLTPGSPFYKTFPIDCSRSQVSVDLWVFDKSYTDIATLTCLPRYTAGQTFYYPEFNAARPAIAARFAHELGEVLAAPISFEAVLRLRATRGIRPVSFHGNFFVRSSDLLALPSVSPDQSYVIECEIEETLSAPMVVFQSVVLHSTSDGERRIRVTTLALPTTSSLSEVYASADPLAIAAVWANKAVEKSLHARLDDARSMLRARLAEILSGYRATMTNARGGGQLHLNVPHNLETLPLLALGVLRTSALRLSTQLSPDQRAYSNTLLTTLPMERLGPYLVPCFYSLHNMPPEAGKLDPATQLLVMPPRQNLSSERVERHGLYLIDNGMDIVLWLGRSAVPQLTVDVFGAPDYASMQSGAIALPALDNDMSKRVHAIVQHIQSARHGVYLPTVYLVKEDGDAAMRLAALGLLVEDRFEQTAGYQQFLTQLRDKVNGT